MRQGNRLLFTVVLCVLWGGLTLPMVHATVNDVDNLSVCSVVQKKAAAKSKNKKGAKSKGKSDRKDESGSHVIRADVEAWLLANNPGLVRNFLTKEPPDKIIKLPNGQQVPIYRLKQFLEVNFRINLYVRIQQKGSQIVGPMEERMRKLLAHPKFYEAVKSHRSEYVISPKGKVSAQQAYNHIRGASRRLSVTADKKIKAPVGGGGGIAAPSWAVWKAMNILYHEVCHCIGIGHGSGGLSGPIAGKMRDWDRKKLWNYETIDLNAMTIP